MNPDSYDDARERAARAVEELRESVGLPSDTLAREFSGQIAALAKEKGVLVEWNLRVIRPGATVEAVCNCSCYA